MRILLVEDHPDLGDAMESKLGAAGHSVHWVREGDTALRLGLSEPWDAVVLDIMLPGGRDGFSVIRAWRASAMRVPVLVVTARAQIEDKVDMLDLGADDYLVKPFDLRELEARLRALVRRPAGQASSLVTYGNLQLDAAARSVAVGGLPVELGRREFQLLELLLSRVNQTVTKERLMSQLFAFEDVSPNALELLISRLRRKLVGATLDIATVRGVGYRASRDAAG